ncbi:hypothetical protein GQ457_15G015450 [Hibiscus cannabinus]
MEHVRETDEEAVLKPPKSLSTYMNFYVSQCKGMKLEGGKREMDNNVCYKKKMRLSNVILCFTKLCEMHLPYVTVATGFELY